MSLFVEEYWFENVAKLCVIFQKLHQKCVGVVKDCCS